MSDLSRFTDAELFNEVHRRFPGRACIWEDEDVALLLEGHGYKATQKNIDEVWSSVGRWLLVDNMVDAGREALEDAILFASDELALADGKEQPC